MEDTLRGSLEMNNIAEGVLILIIMEDTLRASKKLQSNVQLSVLILIIMEDTLREFVITMV